jgi:predicted TIM-barrel fold metal-dependent hydrolase
MKRKYNIVNVGSHANPPPDMWVNYFPKELRDKAPVRVMHQFPDGEFEAVMLEGVPHRQLGVQVGLGSKQGIADYFDPKKSPYARSFLDGPAGQRDPAARLVAQDQDGIDADVIVHPGYPILIPTDRATRWGMMYAFNCWLAEFCAHDPARLIGIGEIPVWDVQLAVKEARRIAKAGLKGVLMPAVPGYEGAWSSPADAPYTDPRYAALWSALDELGLVMVVHADAAAATRGLENYTNAAINMIINKTLPGEMIASLIVGHVFRDHRNLKLVCVETGVGWMAHLVSWMDVLVREHPAMYPGLAELPSATFHRHVFGSFLWDTVGVLNRNIIGVDNIMWCNDFPHAYGPWPNSIDLIRKELAELDEESRHRILAGNAERVFAL